MNILDSSLINFFNKNVNGDSEIVFTDGYAVATSSSRSCFYTTDFHIGEFAVELKSLNKIPFEKAEVKLNKKSITIKEGSISSRVPLVEISRRIPSLPKKPDNLQKFLLSKNLCYDLKSERPSNRVVSIQQHDDSSYWVAQNLSTIAIDPVDSAEGEHYFSQEVIKVAETFGEFWYFSDGRYLTIYVDNMAGVIVVADQKPKHIRLDKLMVIKEEDGAEEVAVVGPEDIKQFKRAFALSENGVIGVRGNKINVRCRNDLIQATYTLDTPWSRDFNLDKAFVKILSKSSRSGSATVRLLSRKVLVDVGGTDYVHQPLKIL